jgi:hypothetical protein
MINLDVHFEVALLIPEGAIDISRNPSDWVSTEDHSLDNVSTIEVSFKGYLEKNKDEFEIDCAETNVTKGVQDADTIMTKCGITKQEILDRLWQEYENKRMDI